MYDVVIVGGGIAGLYIAYQLLQFKPSINLILYEQKKLGGRAGNILFENVSVVTGAGIGRYEKDRLLLDLMSEMDLPVHTFKTSHNYKVNTINAKRIFEILQEIYLLQPVCTTFKKFALSVMPEKIYKKFIVMSGFTDYENEDARDTLFHYGFEDNLEDFTAFSVPWKKLVKKLAKSMSDRIHINTVTQIKRHFPDSFRTTLKDGTFVYSQKVVLATEIDTVKRLVPVQTKRYSQIKGQPFLRLYVKCSPKSIEILRKYIKGTTIVNGPLQKILSMDADKGIYMIYADNASAKKLLPYIKNTSINCRLIAILMSNALSSPKIEIESMLGVYWKIGTHYYTPTTEKREDFIYHVQRPLKNMFVVGEMVSLNQGWVEGALESVEQVFDEIL